MAGSVFYLAPVDNASGKIFGKKQKFVAVRRKRGKRQRGCAVIGERTTPYGASELAWQEMFAQICAATRERMMDPNPGSAPSPSSMTVESPELRPKKKPMATAKRMTVMIIAANSVFVILDIATFLSPKYVI